MGIFGNQAMTVSSSRFHRINQYVARNSGTVGVVTAMVAALGLGALMRVMFSPTPEAATTGFEAATSESLPAATSESSSTEDASAPGSSEVEPLVAAAGPIQLSPLPALLQSTTSQSRLPEVAANAGRFDPFGSITAAPPPPTPAAANAATPSAEDSSPSSQPSITATAAPAVPVSNNTPLPPLPSVPLALPPVPTQPLATVPVANLPSPSVAAAPLALPTPTGPLAERIEITGVAQVGSQVHAIVREPDGSGSRYVAAGDYLAGGQVLVKRIEVGVNSEPRVVLEQGGREYTRSVGGASAMAGLM
jgi:hypothetical protein